MFVLIVQDSVTTCCPLTSTHQASSMMLMMQTSPLMDSVSLVLWLWSIPQEQPYPTPSENAEVPESR